MEALAVLAVVVLVLVWLWKRIGKPYMEQADKAAAARRAPTSKPVARPVVTVQRRAASPSGASADDYVSPYLHSSRWEELLVPDQHGLPPLHLTRFEGNLWLTENTTGLLVNVGNQALRKLGLWSVSVRGHKYYATAARAAELTPGSPVALVREPDNPHDKNAIAIHAANAPGAVGHYNKGMAAGLAKLLDSGTPLQAIAVAGERAGRYTGKGIKVVATSPEIMAHLLRGNRNSVPR